MNRLKKYVSLICLKNAVIDLIEHCEIFLYFQILYLESGTSEKPNELKLPNCDLQCPLEEFKRIVEPVIPKDWYEECFKQT